MISIKRILKIIISIAFLFYLKLRKFILRSKQQGNLLILYYHSINESKKNKFEKQIKYLANNFNLINGSFSNIDLTRQNILVTFDDAMISVKKNGLPILKKYGISCMIFVPTGLLGEEPSWEVHREKINKNDRIMSDQELLAIFEDYDIILGSHSHTHKDLKKVNESTLIQELILSKKKLESICKTEVKNFSFPYGSYDDNIVEKIIRLGYQRIFTSKPEVIDFDINKRIFGRVSVNPEDSFLEYWLKINGAYSWIPFAGKFKGYLKKVLLLK